MFSDIAGSFPVVLPHLSISSGLKAGVDRISGVEVPYGVSIEACVHAVVVPVRTLGLFHERTIACLRV